MASDGQSTADKRTIKQVANLYDTTIATLHYYEQVGLFSAHRDETNGYRIYCGEDFAHLNLFRTLREMNIPLSEVKKYEFSHDLSTNIDVLSEELARIDEAIEKIEARRSAVQATLLRYTRALIDAPGEEVRLLELEARPYVLVAEELGEDYNVPLLCAERMHELGVALNVFSMLPSFVLKPEVNSIGAFSARQLFLSSEAPIGVEDHALPEGKYLSVAFRGPIQRTPEVYRRILGVAARLGLSPTGDPVEFWTINEYATSNSSEFVRTLQQRVE